MILEWKPLETDKFIITEYSLSCNTLKCCSLIWLVLK